MSKGGKRVGLEGKTVAVIVISVKTAISCQTRVLQWLVALIQKCCARLAPSASNVCSCVVKFRS